MVTDSMTSAASLPVLLIDDDEDTREIFSLALADEGYRVLTAPNGAAGLDLVRQGPPALILLDLRMPVADGHEFIRAYRQTAGPHAPIILVSAITSLADVAREIAADAYLAKPFDLVELLELVSQHTRRTLADNSLS